jgi:hypothetical protein
MIDAAIAFLALPVATSVANQVTSHHRAIPGHW